MLDLLIKGGLIIDGSSSPGFFGAVGVEGDRLTVSRGDASNLRANRVLDATGKVVCPGFIDVHAHSALMILTDPMHKPKVHQGITTELIGIDGNSYAPFNTHEELLKFIELNSGLEGSPVLPGMWSSVSDYLSLYDNKVAVNIAYIVGNSPLRIWAAGWDDRPLTDRELMNMKALLRESMEEGAFGLSTGLDYPPGSYADTDELSALSLEAGRLGGIYHTHVRYKLGDRYLDPFKEALEIGRRGEIPVHITHLFRRLQHSGGGRRVLQLVEDAREEGMDVTFDGSGGLYGGSRILIVFPGWAHDGGPDKLKKVLSSPEGRERLRQEINPQGKGWHEMWLTYFKRSHNQQYEGKSVAEMADMANKHPVDALCDLLLDEDLQVSYVGAGNDPTRVWNFTAHPLHMVGTDALLLGDFPTPQTYGGFPFILSDVVREEKKLSLQEAIRKMTSFPAQRLGIQDRGLLREGMKADITVFDPTTIMAHATRENPKQFSTGIEYVIVNGVVVMDQGHHTGALPGRALRHGRS